MTIKGRLSTQSKPKLSFSTVVCDTAILVMITFGIVFGLESLDTSAKLAEDNIVASVAIELLLP